MTQPSIDRSEQSELLIRGLAPVRAIQLTRLAHRGRRFIDVVVPRLQNRAPSTDRAGNGAAVRNRRHELLLRSAFDRAILHRSTRAASRTEARA